MHPEMAYQVVTIRSHILVGNKWFCKKIKAQDGSGSTVSQLWKMFATSGFVCLLVCLLVCLFLETSVHILLLPLGLSSLLPFLKKITSQQLEGEVRLCGEEERKRPPQVPHESRQRTLLISWD